MKEQQIAEPISSQQQDVESQGLAVDSAPKLLPLDAAQRVVSYRSNGKVYRHFFRRLRPEDWHAFFEHVVAEFCQEGNGYSQLIDREYASLVLYARAIQNVEGFSTDDGKPLREYPSWPECVPPDHRLLAAEILTHVGIDTSVQRVSAAGKVAGLSALWTESEPGAMAKYSGLEHIFSFPTIAHRQQFLRAKNRTFVAGGSRAGTTRMTSAHPMLVKLYDELIQEVRGYSLAGSPLQSRNDIVRDMDALHKSVAVAELFPLAARQDEASEDTKEQ